ncbi:hypothetical protein LCGC14_1945560 [marine sediment metagenome]|uniref:Uncharacterized protein n=1 Tax=marine sediment metagenome TaxID=412755 RepID=A0A0F9FJB2_9ZZZZ
MPFSLVGGTRVVQQEIKVAKAQPKPEMKLDKPSEVTVPYTPLTTEDRQAEADLIRAENKANKALKAMKTGDSIIIETSYAGIKDGRDSGFRTVEIARAQGYADMKDGEVQTFKNVSLENSFVAENHKDVLNYLKEKYPKETVAIEKKFHIFIKNLLYILPV